MSIVSAASLCHPRECATLNVVTASQPANEIDEAFQFFDANADGVLTTKEFSTMVRSLGDAAATRNQSLHRSTEPGCVAPQAKPHQTWNSRVCSVNTALMRTSLWISACALPEHLRTWGLHWQLILLRCSRVNEMMGKIYAYTAKRDKQKLLDAFKVFDPDNTGRISVEMFEKEILQEIGEKMDDEKEVLAARSP